MSGRLRQVLGLLSALMAVATLVIPLFVGAGGFSRVGSGYLGYFVGNYFGYGILLLPLLVHTHDPLLLTLVGTLGFTVDEIFSWYAGSVSQGLDSSRPLHARVQSFVQRRGLKAIFVLGLLPLPGLVYAASSFAAGHFGIPLSRFFLANFTGKLIRTAATTALFVVWF